MENMLETLVKKAEKEVDMAMKYATNIESADNKTDCLNAEFHMGKFGAFMDIIEELDSSMNKYVEIGANTYDKRQFILERIDRLYR